ncbi:MAG: DUF1003 domain-containing protein [Candidatus Nanopelagicales bacterium]|nr:DUF1003 domain-containing protein [Candidatus Nanopelagicales bacterium]
MADNKRARSRSPLRSRRTRLDQPYNRSSVWRLQYDPETFGKWSEGVARYIGSWRFIAWMTVIVVAWVSYNIIIPADWRADPYPFIFLTLLLSLQASYAAPLILLAQNRQDDRDRVQYEEDRARTDRQLADTEYLMREIASLRSALGEMATRDYLRSELRDMLEELRADPEGGDPDAS